MRRFTTAVFFLSVLLPLSGTENEMLSFGEDGKFHYVIALPEDGSGVSTARFRKGRTLLQDMAAEGRLPDARVSLALTRNDYSLLPENLRPAVPEGTAGVIAALARSGSGAVFLVLPWEIPGETIIKCGVRGETSPPELVSALATSLEKAGIPWRLEESRLELYRMGWMPEHHILKAYLEAGIPAVAVSTSADVLTPVLEAVRSLAALPQKPDFSDRHYVLLRVPGFLREAAEQTAAFVYKASAETAGGTAEETGDTYLAGGRFFLLTERLLISAAVFFSSVFLFYLCIFILGNPITRRRRTREFWLTLPYPVLFTVINIFALYAGERFAAALVSLRFGKPEAWVLVPRLALFIKFSAAFLLAGVLSGIKNIFLFPRSAQSMGYTAALSSFANIFLFSAIEFSVASHFILCFLLVLICIHSGNKIIQTLFTAAAVLVFTGFYSQLFRGNQEAISTLYNGGRRWDILAACFAVPVQLLVARIFITGRKRIPASVPLPFFRINGKSLRAPVIPAAALLLTLGGVAGIFCVRAWSREKPLQVTVSQSITEEGSEIRIHAPAELRNVRLQETRRNPDGSPVFPDPRPEDFVRVDFQSQTFLDRDVYEIIIHPKINARRIDVRVFSKEGIAVNISPQPFYFEEGGTSARFTSGENPETPLRVNFITGNAGALDAEISCWSVVNPFGLHIAEDSIVTNTLFFVRKTVRLSEGRE